MEEIIHEALSKGVEMHVAGEFDLAGQLYESVIKLQPNHADANHNMGLLKLDTGNDLEALPYLQTALQADTSIVQFWLSYIKALIKLDRRDEAGRILDLAKESGIESEEFVELTQLINTATDSTPISEPEADIPSQSEPNILESLKLNQALRLAEKKAKDGDTEEALGIYKDILAKFPKNKMAQKGLAATNKPKQSAAIQGPPEDTINQLINLYNQGQLAAVVEKAQALTKQYPTAFAVWNILGASAAQTGQLDKAINAFKRVIAIKPDYAEASYNMGNALKEQGKLEQAIASYKKAMSLKPDYAEASYNMGVTFQEQGKLDEAIASYKKALSLKPDYAEAYNNMGNGLQEQGKLEEAIASYNEAMSLKPDYAVAHINMGNALKDQGKLDEAIASYNKALAITPDYAEAYNNMGIALKEQGKLDEATVSYQKALSLKPDYAEAYNNMGVTLQEQDKLDEAILSYQKALSLKPDYAEAYNNMGNGLQAQGKLEEAIASFNKALSLKPDFAEAHYNLSSLVKYQPEDTQVTLVSEMIKRLDLKDDDRCHLHYTLAKMNEDLGDIASAYENYVAGGKLRKKLLSYDLKQDEVRFDQIKATAPGLKELACSEPSKAATNTPIFILGMPRSGTTLVEQIISSHSKVHGAGELLFWSRFGDSLSRSNQVITSENVIQLRNAYLNELKKVSNGCPFVTDKMPQNFRYIGLLLKALPEAKVIHVQRDPAATCWSNFKHYFDATGLGYSYDLKDTANYFKLYQDLMEFWDQQYSEHIYHLDYDRLTIEQEPETRKLIEHLELDWEDNCLSPQENKRSVRTSSQQQVRQKVYTGSSQAWRKFEPFLDGIFDQLEA